MGSRGTLIAQGIPDKRSEIRYKPDGTPNGVSRIRTNDLTNIWDTLWTPWIAILGPTLMMANPYLQTINIAAFSLADFFVPRALKAGYCLH